MWRTTVVKRKMERRTVVKRKIRCTNMLSVELPPPPPLRQQFWEKKYSISGCSDSAKLALVLIRQNSLKPPFKEVG